MTKLVGSDHIYGEWRAVKNPAINAKGSIHDEETAKKLGMRGGAVAGTNHLNLFPPLLLNTFGQRWFEKGSLSIFYTFATKDREEVRAVMGVLPKGKKDAQVEAWVEMRDGTVVGRGTVGVGNPAEPSYIMSLKPESSPPEELRILKGMRPGQEFPPKDVTITPEDVSEALVWLSDPMDWFTGTTPWGGAILSMRNLFNALSLGPATGIRAVGFYGGTDIRIINGPAMVGQAFHTTGRVVSAGVTPKTEFYWYDSELTE